MSPLPAVAARTHQCAALSDLSIEINLSAADSADDEEFASYEIDSNRGNEKIQPR